MITPEDPDTLDDLDIEIVVEIEEPDVGKSNNSTLPTFKEAMKNLRTYLDKLRKEGKIK